MKLRHIIMVMTPMVLISAGCAPQVDMAAEEEAIRAMSNAWQGFDAEQDAVGVAGLFADDGVLYWEQRAPVSGPQAVQEFMTTDYAENPGGAGEWAPDRILVAASGDLAVEQGAWEDDDIRGRYMTVYTKVGEGWKITADVSLRTTPNGGAPAWAVEQLSEWYDAWNSRDAQRLATLYSRDARTTGAQGRAALMTSWEANWAENESETCSGGYDGFQIIGAIATGWGRDTCTITPSGGGAATVERSRWLAVLEQQADGSWLLIRDFGEPVE